MIVFNLYEHQRQALKETEKSKRCAYYLDMGLGKTFVGSEKMWQLDSDVNLVICQKSKVDDWIKHFNDCYSSCMCVWDLTNPRQFDNWEVMTKCRPGDKMDVGVINYELAFRRPSLAKLRDFTLMLDESSMIQNEQAKRSKFILKLQPENVILLSGTPTSGKYEKLYSQIRLLGWDISKDAFWNTYIKTIDMDYGCGFPIKKVVGYKNVDQLKQNLADHGAVFMKTDDVFDLPEQMEQTVIVPMSKEYKTFQKDSYINVDGADLVGDTSLTKMLYERMLCGHYSKEKLQAYRDLLESTRDRLIVFYNFDAELDALVKITREYTKHISVVNGKKKDLSSYEKFDDSVTFIQYQAGAMGLNLQKANKIIYFTLTQWCELFMQSKKRTHRIGQKNTCFYYYLICRRSVEEKIYKALSKGVDYTMALYEKGDF